MNYADYINKIDRELDSGNPNETIINALRLRAELEGLLPKPLILYDGDTKDAKEAQKGKVSLLKKLINYIKKYEEKESSTTKEKETNKK